MGDLAAGYLAWWRWVHFLFGLRNLKSVANYLPYTQRWRWMHFFIFILFYFLLKKAQVSCKWSPLHSKVALGIWGRCNAQACKAAYDPRKVSILYSPQSHCFLLWFSIYSSSLRKYLLRSSQRPMQHRLRQGALVDQSARVCRRIPMISRVCKLYPVFNQHGRAGPLAFLR